MKFVKMGLYMVGDVSVKLSLLANRWVCIMGGGRLTIRGHFNVGLPSFIP